MSYKLQPMKLKTHPQPSKTSSWEMSIGKLVTSKRDMFLDPYSNVLSTCLGLRRLEKHFKRSEFMNGILVLENGSIDIDLTQLLWVSDGPISHPIVFSHDCKCRRHQLESRSSSVWTQWIGCGVVQAEVVFGQEEFPCERAHGLVVEVGVCQFYLRLCRYASDEERIH